MYYRPNKSTSQNPMLSESESVGNRTKRKRKSIIGRHMRRQRTAHEASGKNSGESIWSTGNCSDAKKPAAET